MRRHGDAYWSLLEVERHLRNALSIVRTAGRLVADSSSIRAEVWKIDDLLADAAAHIPAIALGGAGADYLVDYSVLEEGIEKAGKTILEQAEAVFHGADVPVEKQYRSGEPSREILAAAAEVKADLIVMGSRGLGQIGGLILGSVSERVLHGAHIPVLIVR